MWRFISTAIQTHISLFTIWYLFKNLLISHILRKIFPWQLLNYKTWVLHTPQITHHWSYYKKIPGFTEQFCISHQFSGSTLSQCEALPEHFWASCTSVRLCPHLGHVLTFWLCVLSHICVFAAHPNSPEAALGAGGRAGGVPFGSQTVHGVCLRPDRMSTVSLYFKSNNNHVFYLFLSIYFLERPTYSVLPFLEHFSINCLQNICLKIKKLKCLFITQLNEKS